MNNKTKQYKRSKFNTAASRRGMDAEEFASMVLANPSEYSQETINKAKYMLPKYGIGGDIFGGAASGIGAGAAFGGPVGAAIGAWFGGVGAVPGAIIGGIIGGFLGGWGGTELGGAAVEWFY